ncbi:MAG TPA: glycosyltransferase family 1 protein [Lachnospiraceae bacterium]|nr:glycosyltransferase family 1 protein [Lachnospiraceae bacterium]
MINRIIMFCGDIETTAYFSEQMAKTFNELGMLTFFYDYTKEKESAGKLLSFIRKGETAVVTFNFHGLTGESEAFFDEEEGRYIWEEFDIPCINIAVDHPFYYHRFLEKVPPEYIHISIDENHDAYMKHYFPEIKRGPFLPLAGTSLYPDGSYKKLTERSMDICFVGNYVPPENFAPYMSRNGKEYEEFYRGILDELIKDPSKLLEDVAADAIKREIPEATEKDIKDTLPNMIFLDMYVRFHFRGEVIRILSDAGYKIHCYGSGFEDIETKHPGNIISGGSLDSEGCLKMLSDSVICLNVMPWFKRGAHDRIFNTMLNGGVSLTDSSLYLDNWLKDKDNSLIYSLSDLENLPGIVGSALSDKAMLQDIADNGFKMASEYHTWKQRALIIAGLLV